MRPILVGQAPSKTTDGDLPFVGRSGARLQQLLDAVNYGILAQRLDLRNLLERWPGHTNGNGHGRRDGRRRHGGDHFPWAEAQRSADRLWDKVTADAFRGQGAPPLLFAGTKVAECFGLRRTPPLVWVRHTWRARTHLVAILPHPSGVNHFWNAASNRLKARRFLQSACGLKIDPGGRKRPALKR